MLRLQLRKDDYSRRAYNRAFVAASIVFIVLLFGINRIWRFPKNEIVRLSLRTTPARIVMSTLSHSPQLARAKSVNLKKNDVHGVSKRAVPSIKQTKPKTKPLVQKQPAKVTQQKKKAVQNKKTVPAPPQKKQPAPPQAKEIVQKKTNTAFVKKPKQAVQKPVISPAKKTVPEKKVVTEKKPAVAVKPPKKEAPKKMLDVIKQPEKIEPVVKKIEPPVKKEVEKAVVKKASSTAPEKNKAVLAEKSEPVDEKQDLANKLEQMFSRENETVVQSIPVIGENSDGGGALDRDSVALVAAIRRVWRLPGGLKTDLRAHVLLQIDKSGGVGEVRVVRSSGVVAYDLAARAALHRAKYPQVFWGKNILIEFGKELSE